MDLECLWLLIQNKELNVRSESIISENGRWAGGLVDVLKDELHAKGWTSYHEFEHWAGRVLHQEDHMLWKVNMSMNRVIRRRKG